MQKFFPGLLAVACAAAFATAAQAATPMTKSEYNAAKDQAEATYKVEKKKCDSLSGNAEDICEAEAKANKMRAEADAKAAYKHTRDVYYDQKVAHADADYLVAKEKCDDLAGNTKDVCVKEAKAAQTKAKADAKAEMKSAKANGEARSESSDAKHEATEEKREADYKVQIERCDSLAGDAKDACVKHAKQMYGKS